MRTVLVDYGASNLHSVHKALAAAGLDAEVVSEPRGAEGADAMVLPGQGHFGQAMRAFLDSGFEGVLRAHLDAGRPFLGICVGLQLLMEGSEEAPGVAGLGLLAGRVRRFRDPTVSVPQMGWNRLRPRGAPALLAGVDDGAYVYFCNSYYVDFDGSGGVADGPDGGGGARLPGATTRYGETEFLSAVQDEATCAVQFHPEKSQRVGLAILGNFRRLVHGRGTPA